MRKKVRLRVVTTKGKTRFEKSKAYTGWLISMPSYIP
jgi:hypothetical protein